MVQITLSLHRQRLLLSHTDWDRGTPHGAAPSHTAASGEPNIEHSFTAASRVDVERKSVPTHDFTSTCRHAIGRFLPAIWQRCVSRSRARHDGAAAATEALARRSKSQQGFQEASNRNQHSARTEAQLGCPSTSIRSMRRRSYRRVSGLMPRAFISTTTIPIILCAGNGLT